MRAIPLPTQWFDEDEGRHRPVGRRLSPWYMGGTLDVAAATAGAQFNSSTFTHALSFPFEILRWVPRVTTYVTGTTIQSDPAGARVVGDELYRWVRIKIEGIGKARAWMNSMNLLSTLLKGFDSHVELDDPYYLKAGWGLQVTINNDLTAALAGGGIRMELTFHGSLIDCSTS